MIRKIILLVLVIMAVTSLEISPQADGKVVINFYYESLCPDCLSFVGGSFKRAAATKDFWKICEVNMFPYGNARTVKNGSSWSFTCQHGARQCQGNIIQTCALRKYQPYQYGIPFIICLQANTSDWISQGRKCATQLNMDWNAINSCSTSAQGNQYEYEMSVATDKLSPAHTYVPWITVNGQHSSSAQNAIISNMVKYVCSIYKGTQKIDACM